MKKAVIATLALALALCGCTSGENGVQRTEDSPKPNLSQRFLCEDSTYRFETVVDKQTGVTYLIWKDGSGKYSKGGITVLLNRNGYPVISEEAGE